MTDPGGWNLWQDGVGCRQRGRPLSVVRTSPPMSWTRGVRSTLDCATGRSAPEHAC